MGLLWGKKDADPPRDTSRSIALSQAAQAAQAQFAHQYYGVMGGFQALPTIGPDKLIQATRSTEILAWRAWRLGAVEAHLRAVLWSVTRDVKWPGPVLTADKTPSADHLHGIYALRKPAGNYRPQNAIHGVVALSGTVVEGTSGYRAERAVIRALWVQISAFGEQFPDRRPIEVMAAMEERYQCPVTFAYDADADRDIEQMLKAAA